MRISPDSPNQELVDQLLPRCERRLESGGHLVIEWTGPPFAILEVNGQGLLRLPHDEPVALPSGDYALTSSFVDHFPVEATATIRAGETARVALRMDPHPQYGTIEIRVNQEGVPVSIDGRVVGTGPSIDPVRLRTGRVLVAVDAPGFHPWQRYVEIERDQEHRIDIRLLDASLSDWDLGLTD
ncbi:MAG: PEGA domain-containing protein [Deltaproteobacteria bacterium]|nr:MAG: PEGA domain-containing protein [Deltaproteobacteria bacterium]